MHGVYTVEHKPFRAAKEFLLTETFGVETSKSKVVHGFAEPGYLTPDVNPYYRFPKQDLIMFLMALSTGDSVYLQGHSGTGKTELVNQVAARLNYNVVQVNFDGHLLRGDLVGDMRLVDGATVFQHGLVPLGFTLPGTILLFDEVDAVSPETAFVLQRAVSGDRRMLLHETRELFELHPQNHIVATANTSGLGDETSLYMAGTHVQNFSFQNRWDTVIQLDYLSPDQEEALLQEMFSTTEAAIIKSIVAVMAHARESFSNGQLSAPLTTRDAIRWLHKLNLWPLPMLMAEYTFLNRMPIEDAMAVADVIDRVFRLPDKDSRKFASRSV